MSILSNRFPFFGEDTSGEMEVNRVDEKEKYQTRPSQDMSPSSGMEDHQRRIGHGAPYSCQPDEQVPVLSCDEIFPVAANGQESFLTNHLKFATYTISSLKTIVSQPNCQVHYREDNSIGVGFFCRKNPQIYRESKQPRVRLEVSRGGSKELVRIRHDAVCIEEDEQFTARAFRALVFPLGNGLSRSAVMNHDLVRKRARKIDSVVPASAVRNNDLVRNAKL